MGSGSVLSVFSQCIRVILYHSCFLRRWKYDLNILLVAGIRRLALGERCKLVVRRCRLHPIQKMCHCVLVIVRKLELTGSSAHRNLFILVGVNLFLQFSSVSCSVVRRFMESL